MRGVIPLLSKQFINAQRVVGPSSTFPFLLAARASKHPLLVVTSSSRSSEDLVNELRELYDNVIEFPAWETLPHERLSPRSDTVALRIKSLYALKEKHKLHPIIVTPVRGVIHRIINDLGSRPLLQLRVGQEQSMEELVRHLSSLAYIRTDLVERRGEFAVRGGIVDLFLPLSDYPMRIDFFGDEIEDISFFEVSDQRTIKPIDSSITIFPCRELLLTEDVKKRAQKAKGQNAGAEEMLEKISEGIIFEGM
jgi:transcription-repair coupling factor (superfamily II helicase)